MERRTEVCTYLCRSWSYRHSSSNLLTAAGPTSRRCDSSISHERPASRVCAMIFLSKGKKSVAANPWCQTRNLRSLPAEGNIRQRPFPANLARPRERLLCVCRRYPSVSRETYSGQINTVVSQENRSTVPQLERIICI